MAVKRSDIWGKQVKVGDYTLELVFNKAKLKVIAVTKSKPMEGIKWIKYPLDRA